MAEPGVEPALQREVREEAPWTISYLLQDMKIDLRENTKRIEELSLRMDEKIEGLRTEMGEKIEGLRTEMGEKIEGLRTEMNTRFERIDERFERMEATMHRQLMWMITTTIAIGGVIIGAIKIL